MSAGRQEAKPAELDWALRQLRASVEVLGAPAEDQSGYLERIGFSGTHPWNVDELALQFDDLYLLADQLTEAGRLTNAQLAALADLDRLLGAMSGPERPELWSEDALRTTPEWEQVRELARKTLTLLDAPDATT